MNAMIFAAGLGTRLKPYTNEKPKALVEVNGKPMIYWQIQQLKHFGFKQLVVNVHHFADKLESYILQNFPNDNIKISDEREKLLDTGGGIKHALNLFDNDLPILIHNVDILSQVDLKLLYERHEQTNAAATLVVRDRDTNRYLLVNNAKLVGWKNTKTNQFKWVNGETKNKSLAFSGIHVVSQDLIRQIEETGKFSIIDSYLTYGKTNQISIYEDQSEYWLDMGKPAHIEQANNLIPLLYYTRAH